MKPADLHVTYGLALQAGHEQRQELEAQLADTEKALSAALADRRDMLAVLSRVADALDVSAEALIEDPSVAIRSARGSVRELREIAERNAANAQHLRATAIEAEQERDAARAEVEMLRGVGCGEPSFIGAEIPDGPCGACLKCARRERDEARAEVEGLSQLVTTSDRQLGDEIIGLRRELSEALRRMKTAQNERDFANERLRRLKAETGWAKRECDCQCQWEEGDSPCPVHGEEAK